MTRTTYTHNFVKAFPERLEEGVLYVSVEFATAAHRCFCGCGCEVYTRFSPTDWSIRYDGQTVSVSPSIGNWSFVCESHYVLANGRVRWADKWSRERIAGGRALDRQRKERQFGGAPPPAAGIEDQVPDKSKEQLHDSGWLVRLVSWMLGK